MKADPDTGADCDTGSGCDTGSDYGSGLGASADAGATRQGAKSLLLTILGEFVHPHGGSVWTSSVVAGLGALGVGEGNARQAMARLGDQGIVEREKVGRRTRWHLTEPGTRLLAEGTERIYAFGHGAEPWDRNWLMVICAIPDRKRGLRNRFRTRLSFEGFGLLAPTIAISPHVSREDAANEILAELGLQSEALTFRSVSGSLTSDANVLATAWDLQDLARAYDRFVDSFSPSPADLSIDCPGEVAFADIVRLVDAWRRFPFIDPELPAELLPADWAGTSARGVFVDLHTRWRGPAERWFLDLELAAGS